MTTEATPKVAPIASYSTDEQFYATRYRQGGRTVYLVALTPDQIINNILRPNPDVPNPGNRRIRPAHAKGFAEYYLHNENWVIPGIILRAPGIFEFNSDVDVLDNSAAFGVLSYPKRKQREIQILDGQHRILGFHLALEMLDTQRNKAIDHLQRARRTEEKGSRVIKDAEAEVKAIDAKMDRFSTERVAIEIQVTDDIAEYRQMFYDIAENALGITAAVKARFDGRKAINRALEPVLEHPLLRDRVDMDIDRLGAGNPNLLSAKHVIEILRANTVGIDGRIGKRVEKTLVDQEIAKQGLNLFSTLTDIFAPLKQVQDGQLTPAQLRQSSMLGSPLFLRILAAVRWDLATNHAFTDGMIRDFYALLAPHMASPAHENSIWKKHVPDHVFEDGAFAPRGRRQDYAQLTETLVDWAITKPEFLSEPPAPAPEPETDEDAGIDFAPDHDTTALEVEVRNEAEEVAAEGRKRAKAVKPAAK